MTDANEAVFSPPTPPSRCSRRAPSPGTRASARPLPPALRARVGPGARAGRSGRGSGSRSGSGIGSGSGREVGGRGGRPGGLLARPRSPSPGPSAGARQANAIKPCVLTLHSFNDLALWI
ncbi:WAS protein family homolog 6-like [Orcinus orca]|uniref:WAS protein family homolog 6-like n=1 Tax=Orcinus orca TaxID=9733 RepID=UPI0021118A33|nr:WAS protein family homolog 6-like [Orcinus orca]